MHKLQTISDKWGKSFKGWVRIPLMNYSNVVGVGEIEISPDPEYGWTRIIIRISETYVSINQRDIKKIIFDGNENVLIKMVNNTARIRKLDDNL